MSVNNISIQPNSRQVPVSVLASQLSERERKYLKKIGEAGRKTLNYDLDICRSLERAELVVDKGRRYALTHRGQELFQFI